MQKYVLVLTSSAALLAGSALAASAQQSDIPSMGEQLAQTEHSPESEDERGGMMGHNRMTGCHMMGHHGMMGGVACASSLPSWIAIAMGRSHCRNFKRRTSASLKRWTPIRTARSRSKRSSTSCTEATKLLRSDRTDVDALTPPRSSL